MLERSLPKVEAIEIISKEAGLLLRAMSTLQGEERILVVCRIGQICVGRVLLIEVDGRMFFHELFSRVELHGTVPGPIVQVVPGEVCREKGLIEELVKEFLLLSF